MSMEENKYYIPSIEEFYISFEFEELLQEKPTKMRVYSKEELKAFPYSWMKLEFNTSHSISSIARKIKDGKIRVKYLDHSDVEELGFEVVKKQNKAFKAKKYFNYGINSLEGNHDGITGYIEIIVGGDLFCSIKKECMCESILFRGVIKNKSELKKILKMLCIV